MHTHTHAHTHTHTHTQTQRDETHDELLEAQEGLFHSVGGENLSLQGCLVAQRTHHKVLHCIALQHTYTHTHTHNETFMSGCVRVEVPCTGYTVHWLLLVFSRNHTRSVYSLSIVY